MQEQHALHERVKMIPKIIHFAWHRLPVTPRFIARCVREYHDREWSAPVTEPGRQERVGITLLPPNYTIWFSRNKWFTGEVPPPQPEAATLHLHGGEWVTDTSFTPTGNFV